MSYIVKQKIGEGVYAYEVQSYWDSEKKQSRQKRRYLGVWDKSTGQIMPKESLKDVKTTKSFGPSYLLDSLGKEIQLRKKLSNAFGKDGDSILAMAMSKLLHQTSLKNLHNVLDDSFLPEMYSLEESFSSQWLSSFLERLSSKDAAMTSFYGSLIDGEAETLIFDITSLSSASRNIDWLEYGYNRDGLDLPQVNLGLVLSLHRHIPLYFKLFPGSINDVVTLKNLVAEVKAFGITKSLFILDRGFYSESNIKEMNSEEIDFILPLPFGVKIGKGLISETNKDIENPANAKRFGGDIFFVLESEVEIGEVNIYGYVLFNKKREGVETNSFFNGLIDIESKLEGKEFRGNPFEHFERIAGNFARYFDCTVDGKTISLRRRVNAISQAANRFGKTILLSATKRSWKDVLSLYRERDEVEKKFDDLKNELEVMPLRIRKVATLQGLLFIFFLSLVLRAMLLRRARTANLLEKTSIEEILMELAKVRAVKVGGKWRITEISKKQRTIFEKMEIGVPVEADIVIKKAGV
jgi:transposase